MIRTSATVDRPIAGRGVIETLQPGPIGGEDRLDRGGMPEVYATIGEIVAGKKKARDTDRERIVAIPIGMAICDIALAHLIYHTALERKAGQQFTLA